PGDTVHVGGRIRTARQLDAHRHAGADVGRGAQAAATGDPERGRDTGDAAMNSTVKRTAVACLFMFLLLMGNVTYIGAVQAEGLKNDPRNARAFFARYNIDRGWITANNGKVTLARTKDTGDATFRFKREYPGG